MLLPRYSLRAMLALALAVAVLGIVGGQAVTGATWAIAVLVAVGSVVLSAMVFALFYALVATFSRVASAGGRQPRLEPHYPAPRNSDESSASTQES